MKFIITFLMILMCGYTDAAKSQQTDTDEQIQLGGNRSIAALELLVKDFTSQADKFITEANSFESADFKSIADKYRALAKKYQDMVKICQNLLHNEKRGLLYALEWHEIYFNENKKLAEGYKELASAHEELIIEIQSTGYTGSIISRHQEYVNQHKEGAIVVEENLVQFSLDYGRLDDQLDILAATEQWIEAHSNFSEFLETINNPRFKETLNELEKAAVKRIIAYNDVSKLNKSSEHIRTNEDLLAAMQNPSVDIVRESKMAADKVKQADRVYTGFHPKGKKATAVDWYNVLEDLDKKVLSFQQEGRCHNSLI